MARRARVNLTDVARAAGVSVATASKALNDAPQVRASTRERVIRCAQALGFEPRNAASAAVAGVRPIGMVASDRMGVMAMPVLAGAERYFSSRGVPVFFANAYGDPELRNRYVASLVRYGARGLIIMGDNANPSEPSADCPVPVVYARRRSTNPDDFALLHDDRGVGALQVDHLTERGCERVGIVVGDLTRRSANERLRGARDRLRELGLSPAFVSVGDTWREEGGRRAVADAMAQGTAFDGLVCGNDELARGALDALRERGVTVPDTVQVIGVDNRETEVRNARPTLTSVDLRLVEMGSLAAQRLMELIGGAGHRGVERFGGTVVQRSSTHSV